MIYLQHWRCFLAKIQQLGRCASVVLAFLSEREGGERQQVTIFVVYI